MMKRVEILETIRELANSQGSYGRLYREVMQLKNADPGAYDKLMETWESEGFETTLDLVLYLEEGKHCKRKFWKIPVTWECHGVVEVEGDTIEEALENFHKAEEEGEGCALPEGNYVDGSFRLSDDDPDELKHLIELLNRKE